MGLNGIVETSGLRYDIINLSRLVISKPWAASIVGINTPYTNFDSAKVAIDIIRNDVKSVLVEA